MKCLKILVLSVAALSTYCSSAHAQSWGRAPTLRTEPKVTRISDSSSRMVGLGLADPEQADLGAAKTIPMPETQYSSEPMTAGCGPCGSGMGCGHLWDNYCGDSCGGFRHRWAGHGLRGCGLFHGCGCNVGCNTGCCIDRGCGCHSVAPWGHRHLGCGHFGHLRCCGHNLLHRCRSCVISDSCGCTSIGCTSPGCTGCAASSMPYESKSLNKGGELQGPQAPMPPEPQADEDQKSARRLVPGRSVSYVLGW